MNFDIPEYEILTHHNYSMSPDYNSEYLIPMMWADAHIILYSSELSMDPELY